MAPPAGTRLTSSGGAQFSRSSRTREPLGLEAQTEAFLLRPTKAVAMQYMKKDGLS